MQTLSCQSLTLWHMKADSHSACQTVACFLYGTWRFITVLTKAPHWTLSWTNRIRCLCLVWCMNF